MPQTERVIILSQKNIELIMRKENNYAYIDGANLYNGVRSSGFDLDYNKFRIWLKDKYQITKAYIFIGMVPEKNDLYLSLKDAGFILVYKEVIYDKIGIVKGNCDADLVLQTVCDYYENQYDRCIVVKGRLRRETKLFTTRALDSLYELVLELNIKAKTSSVKDEGNFYITREFDKLFAILSSS
jgi:hypothetical protein